MLAFGPVAHWIYLKSGTSYEGVEIQSFISLKSHVLDLNISL